MGKNHQQNWWNFQLLKIQLKIKLLVTFVWEWKKLIFEWKKFKYSAKFPIRSTQHASMKVGRSWQKIRYIWFSIHKPRWNGSNIYWPNEYRDVIRFRVTLCGENWHNFPIPRPTDDGFLFDLDLIKTWQKNSNKSKFRQVYAVLSLYIIIYAYNDVRIWI